MDPTAAKQQIAERIKQATNILVTVSTNPSVDQLAACIGLTLMLNKMDKHATAVFSGAVPSTIEFLQPAKTIETNTDSLQDFIISLDKNKADKLRYKVEDDVVRIFITPYKTSLSQKDLVFSQGDFNVEAVMALGVKDRSQLDQAITSHGRILHDATVISVNAGNDKAADLGQINWQDPSASSLSEMLVSISEAFGTGLIDNQMATAFLTGIVAETNRFSNAKTSPKVMTMSAQLMAAGANQQLIVSKLEPPQAPPSAGRPIPKAPPPKPAQPTGTLSISHKPQKPSGPEVQIGPDEVRIDEEGNIESLRNMQAQQAQQIPKEERIHGLTPPPLPSLTPTAPSSPAINTMPMPLYHPDQPQPLPVPDNGPIPGPHTLLNPSDHQPAISPPFTADTQPQWYDQNSTTPTDPLSDDHRPDDKLLGRGDTLQPLATPAPQMAPAPPSNITDVNSARGAVDSAINNAPFDPADHPLTSLNAQPMSQPLHPPPPVPPPLMPTPKQ